MCTGAQPVDAARIHDDSMPHRSFRVLSVSRNELEVISKHIWNLVVPENLSNHFDEPLRGYHTSTPRVACIQLIAIRHKHFVAPIDFIGKNHHDLPSCEVFCQYASQHDCSVSIAHSRATASSSFLPAKLTQVTNSESRIDY